MFWAPSSLWLGLPVVWGKTDTQLFVFQGGSKCSRAIKSVASLPEDPWAKQRFYWSFSSWVYNLNPADSAVPDTISREQYPDKHYFSDAFVWATHIATPDLGRAISLPYPYIQHWQAWKFLLLVTATSPNPACSSHCASLAPTGSQWHLLEALTVDRPVQKTPYLSSRTAHADRSQTNCPGHCWRSQDQSCVVYQPS